MSLLQLHQIDGFIKTLYDSSSSEEWVNILATDKRISHLIKDWNTWLKTCINDDVILKLPFSDIDVEYLNSPIVDSFYKYVTRKRLSWSGCFVNVCTQGNLDLAQWIITNKSYCKYSVKYAFREAIQSGQLLIIQWLCELYSWILPTYVNRTRHDMGTHFKRACKYGHLHIAKWIVDSVGSYITITDYRDAWRSACRNNYLEIAKWIYGVCRDLLNEDIVKLTTFVCEICSKSNLEIVQWMLSLPNIPENRLGHFRNACFNSVEVIRYVVNLYNFDTNMIYSEMKYFNLLKPKKPEVIKWVLSLDYTNEQLLVIIKEIELYVTYTDVQIDDDVLNYLLAFIEDYYKLQTT